MHQSPTRIRHETRLRLAQIQTVEDLTPRMRRLTFSGDQLDGFTSLIADDHVKLFFPASGQQTPTLPTMQDGKPIFPEGAIRPITRDYTPRRFNPQTRELTIEFVIHGTGPASQWAAQAQPGQSIGIGGPRGSLLTPQDYETYLLAGDETALPAIARHLEEMQPGARVLAFIEVAGEAEERHLPTAANATITWLHRNTVPAGTTTLLDEAFRNTPISPGDTYAWIAAEIETARRLRTYLIEEESIPRDQIRAAGYWRIGAAGAHETL